MTRRPTVTVAITSYHREEFISEAVRSVDRQSDLPDELLILQEGPVTGPPAWTEEGEIPVRWFRGHPTQPGGFENTGGMLRFIIENAKGDVVCFLDDDDEFLPGKVETVRSVFATTPDLIMLQHGVIGSVPPRWGWHLSCMVIAPAAFRWPTWILDAIEGTTAATDVVIASAALSQRDGTFRIIPDALSKVRLHPGGATNRAGETDRLIFSLTRMMDALPDGAGRELAWSVRDYNRPGTWACLGDALVSASWTKTKRAAAALLRGNRPGVH